MSRLVLVAALAGFLIAAAPAAAASQKVRAYRVADVRDLLDRSKVTVAGGAIVEIDHAEAVVTANRRTVRRLRRLGFSVKPLAPPKRRGARKADFPAADSTYHNYAEMAAEVQAAVQPPTPPSSRRASASARRTRGARSGP